MDSTPSPSDTQVPEWVVEASKDVVALVRHLSGQRFYGLAKQVQLLILNRLDHAAEREELP